MKQIDLSGAEKPANREQAIRDLFDSMGNVPVHDLAAALVEYGLYSFDEVQTFGMRHLESICKRALKVRDPHGLPYAGPSCETSEHGPIWKNRTFWVVDDYKINIKERVDNIFENHQVAVHLAEECADRYGEVVFVPAITGALELA